MAVMVTGGNGFVGVNVVKFFAQQGIETVLFDRAAAEDPLRDWFLEDVADRVHVVQGDVLDPEQLREAITRYAVNRVVHTAALTPSRDFARDHAGTVLSVNIVGTSNVLDCARDLGIERVVYTSSAAVYKAASELEAVDEYDSLDLNGLYAITKVASEQLCILYSRDYGVDAVAARLGWIYGPMERPGSARTRMSELYNMVAAALDGQTIKSNDFNRYRDWTHAQDIARGLLALLQADNLIEPVYNLSSGNAWPGHELLNLVRQVVGPVDAQLVADRAQANVPVNSPNRRGPLSIARLANDTGFAPEIAIEEGLREYVEWVKKARELVGD